MLAEKGFRTIPERSPKEKKNPLEKNGMKKEREVIL
jgi:hypothetical protein